MSSLDTATRAGDTPPDGTGAVDPPGREGSHVLVHTPPAGDVGVAPSRVTVLVVAIVVAAVRYLYSARRHVFSMAPDEITTGGMAHFLAGGRWTAIGNIYRPGLSTLLAPIFLVVEDPDWRVRLGLMVNAAIAGVTMFWFVPLVARLTQFSHRGVLIVAGAVALMPASLSASAYVWAEPLVTLCFLATLLALVRLADAPRFRFAISAVLWPAVGYTSHGRLLPLVVLALVAIVSILAPARRWRLLTLAVAVGVIAYASSYWYQRWIVSRVWLVAGDSNTSAGVLERLRAPLQVLDSAMGQIWYQLCASALLVGFGIALLGRTALSKQRNRHRTDARLVLWLTLPLMVVSMIFMSDRARADHVVYGRYNDAIIWPAIAVGASWLFVTARSESRKVRWFTVGVVATLTVELALMLRQLHHLQLRVAGVEPMIAGITPASGSIVRVFLITALALGALAVLWLAASLSRTQRVGALAIVVGLVGVAGVRGWAVSEQGANGWAFVSEVKEIEQLGIDPSMPIGVSIMPEVYGPREPAFIQQTYLSMARWYLPDRDFVFDNGPRDAVGPYVLAVTNDALLTRDGGRIVWLSGSRDMALWLEPETLPDGDPNPAYANLTADQP